MKKLTSFVIIFAIFCLSLNADIWMGITPREGSYGVNLASSKYCSNMGKEGAGGEAEGNDPQNKNYYVEPPLGNVKNGEYTDANIIAIGSINNEGDHRNTESHTMEVRITCSNDELAFVSESNPTYKRPFELWLFKTQTVNDDYLWSEPRETFSYEKLEIGKTATLKTIPTDRPVIGDVGTSFAHFNLVLVLPGEFDSEGKLLYDKDGRGKIPYPLINADDYTAYVTITLSSTTAVNSPQTITIPFSGYFNGVSSSEEAKRDDAINVTVNRMPAATNLDIETLSDPDKEEQRVHVADIKMLYFWNDALDEKTGLPLYDSPASDSIRMFFSASNDPFYSNRNGFELVHSSVDIASIHNPYNSIGYRIEANSYTVTAPEDKSNWIYHNTNGDTSIGSPTLRAFTGEDKITDVTDRKLSNEVVTPGAFIYPEIHGARSSQDDFDRYYSYWESPVYLVMDKRQVDNMFAGRYTSTVYFHVVADEQRKPYTGG